MFINRGFLGGSVIKNPSAHVGDAGDVGSTPGLGRSLGKGNGNPLQYSCLGNPMDRDTRRATAQGVTKSWTGLSMRVHMHVFLNRIQRRPLKREVKGVWECGQQFAVLFLPWFLRMLSKNNSYVLHSFQECII